MKIQSIFNTVFLVWLWILPLHEVQGQLIQHVRKVGTTSAAFLEIGVGARALAMGEAYVAAANDVTSIYWNPAGMALLEKPGAAFFHSPWLADIDYFFAAAAVPVGRASRLGIYTSSVTMDEMLVRTVQHPDGTGELFTASSISLGLSYAQILADRFRFGANMKFIHEQIWHMTASSVAFDVGTLFTTKNRGINIGMSISNFGAKMKLEGRDTQVKYDVDEFKTGNNDRIDASLDTWEWPLPLIFRVGISSNLLQVGSHRLIAAIDAVHPNNDMEYVNTGVEYNWNDIVFLRAGQSSLFMDDAEMGLALGGGIHYHLGPVAEFRLDYVNRSVGVFGFVEGYSISLYF
jgi:hypothetical protein